MGLSIINHPFGVTGVVSQLWEVITIIILVGGLEQQFYFSIYIYTHMYILGAIIIPTDELIFFRGVAQPPKSYGL